MPHGNAERPWLCFLHDTIGADADRVAASTAGGSCLERFADVPVAAPKPKPASVRSRTTRAVTHVLGRNEKAAARMVPSSQAALVVRGRRFSPISRRRP